MLRPCSTEHTPHIQKRERAQSQTRHPRDRCDPGLTPHETAHCHSQVSARFRRVRRERYKHRTYIHTGEELVKIELVF